MGNESEDGVEEVELSERSRRACPDTSEADRLEQNMALGSLSLIMSARTYAVAS